MKFLVFDTETTGLPKSKYAEPEDTWQFPYVVQLSWLIFNTGTNKVRVHHKNHVMTAGDKVKISNVAD